MGLNSYGGAIVYIDLTKEKVAKKKLDEDFAKGYLGCKGFGARILYDEVSPRVDPFAPENKIILSVGPLTGTSAFGPKCSLVTKSPLTGGFLDSNIGGHIGPELKYAGYDTIVISGRSKRPVYLLIDDDNIEFKKADHLWGKDTHETDRLIKKELNDSDVHIASIGPAGENLVRFACITSDLYRQAGRGGSGAVWGSKKLKAIAIQGSRSVNIANEELFLKYSHDLRKATLEGGGPFATYGTMLFVDLINEYGMLPTKNFQSGVFPEVKKINGDAMLKTIKSKDRACFACSMHCANFCVVKHGSYAPFNIEGPEYETTTMVGPNCGLGNLEAIAYINLLCDKVGLDTISTGNIIGFSMECYEKGVLTKRDTNGLRLTWGNHEAMVELIKKITYREGIGNTLAEGVKSASKEIGKGAEKYAMHVKGLEMPAYDPRGAVGIGLGYATANRGACHSRAWTISEEVMGKLDRFSIEGKPMLVSVKMHRKNIIDALGICEQMGLLPIYVDLLSAATGWNVQAMHNKTYPSLIEDFKIKNENIMIGERIYNLARAFNIREGFRRKEDTLPKRFFEEPLPEGAAEGHFINSDEFDKMLSEYYKIKGWDKNGIPTRKKLVELNLEDVAEDLWS